MKKLLMIVILLGGVFVTSCKKKSESKASEVNCVKALITGFDFTLCACCGGIYFKINNKDYRTQTDLGAINPTWNLIDVVLPMQVTISYKPSKDGCDRETIEITKLEF